MNRIVVGTILFAFFANVGCTKQIDRSTVVGRYQASHDNGVELLELKADGTYVYQYRASDGREVRNTNKWEFECLDEKPMITFSQFVFGPSGYGTPKPGFWVVKVDKSFLGDTLRLCIDPDLGYSYVKKNS